MKAIAALFSFLFLAQALSYDLSHKFGIGGSLGQAIPTFGNNFNDMANPKWSASIHGRYHLDPALGMDLSVSRKAFRETSMKFDNINLLLFWRVNGAETITPIAGIGAGITKIKNYSSKNAKLSLLTRLGAEYSLIPKLSFGVLVDYQYVSKTLGEMPKGAAHIFTPQFAITWYFETAI